MLVGCAGVLNLCSCGMWGVGYGYGVVECDVVSGLGSGGVGVAYTSCKLAGFIICCIIGFADIICWICHKSISDGSR